MKVDLFMDSFAEGQKNRICRDFKLEIFIRKKPVQDIFFIGKKGQNLYPFLGPMVSIMIKIQNRV